MSNVDETAPESPLRVPSGIPGLDAVTQGGFFRGGIYLFLAKPGSGKTILGNQICFRHVAAGGRAVVVTLLTESHSRMITQLKTFDFFDTNQVGRSLSYVSGYQTLEKDKLKGLLALLRRIVRDHKATLLVIDGVVTVGTMAESEVAMKKFIHELQVFVELVGCTTLLLTGAKDPGGEYALRTMVDGLIELHLDSIGMEASRSIEVTKFRGSPTLMGRHLFEISDAGIAIFPRTESQRVRPGKSRSVDRAPSTLGIPAIDRMLGGGLRSGSVTMALGSPGSGKTLFGLSFLSRGPKKKEAALYFGFSEPPADVLRKASTIGLDLAPYMKSGLFEIAYHSPLHAIADALAEKLIATVRERGIRRLYIDGLGGFRDTLVYPERSRRFFAALFDELRSLGVVTMVSDDTRDLGNVELPAHELTDVLDNVVFMRQIEEGSHLRKLMSVLKLREGVEDPVVRTFSIGANGFVVSTEPGAPQASASSSASKEKASTKRGR